MARPFQLPALILRCHSLPSVSLPGASLLRRISSNASGGLPPQRQDVPHVAPKAAHGGKTSDLSNVPSSVLLRSLILGSVVSRPLLFTTCLKVLETIAGSRSPLLNPDRNPVLRAVLKPLVYDHFCAGTNDDEIRGTLSRIRARGFSGVALGYSKEIVIDEASLSALDAGENAEEWEQRRQELIIEQWKEGQLKTISLVEPGDCLGVKFTGAGDAVLSALLQGPSTPPPAAFAAAMDAICSAAASRGARVWIDAEQQAVQPTIDAWTIELMRRWNARPPSPSPSPPASYPLVFNTIQAYLKDSRHRLRAQLQLAHSEGWTLGIKLVRGAYISHEIRERINDTKRETDEMYDAIVADLLRGRIPDVPTPSQQPGNCGEGFPEVALFIAGHNGESVMKALKLGAELARKGELKVMPEFGQLEGMADDVGRMIFGFGEEVREGAKREGKRGSEVVGFGPRVYKSLPWGSVQDCIQYLVRRAVENRGAAERVAGDMGEIKREVRRRVWS